MRDFIETKLKGASSSSWSDATTKRFFCPQFAGIRTARPQADHCPIWIASNRKKGTVRSMHFRTKLVRCTRDAILNIIEPGADGAN